MTAHDDCHSAVKVLHDGRTIACCDYGKHNGTPVFLFHGTPGSRILGVDNDEVCNAGLRIITPERGGYGRSMPNPSATITGWAFDVQELAGQLGVERFHVLGISGGGPYALACAAMLPGRVISATLVSSATPIDLPGFWEGMTFSNRWIFSVASRFPFLLSSICAMYACLQNAWDRGAMPSHAGEAFRQGGIGLEMDLRLLSASWRIPFESISAPVFLWHGEEDRQAPIAGAKALASVIPRCEAYFVPGKGHFLNRDAAISQQIFDRILSVSMDNIPLERDTPKPALPLRKCASP